MNTFFTIVEDNGFSDEEVFETINKINERFKKLFRIGKATEMVIIRDVLLGEVYHLIEAGRVVVDFEELNKKATKESCHEFFNECKNIVKLSPRYESIKRMVLKYDPRVEMD